MDLYLYVSSFGRSSITVTDVDCSERGVAHLSQKLLLTMGQHVTYSGSVSSFIRNQRETMLSFYMELQRVMGCEEDFILTIHALI